jgi:hypothetical protein
MELVIGGASGPCPPCKIILNGGFIAALAPVLAARGTGDVHTVARNLGVAASTYVKMLDVVGITVKVGGAWEGCEQAKLLTAWIGQYPSDAPTACDLIREWTANYWSAIADLAAGKLPV